jgi:pimeloyl-ACP methyl ester carboxylesterase
MEEKIFLDYEYGKLCCKFSPGNSKGIVILGHGLASSKDSRSNAALKPLLNKDGIATLAIDLYAHGESSGTFEELTITKAIAGYRRAYEFAKEKGYAKTAIVGSSFSGIVALLAAVELNPTCVVLKCPVFDYANLWDERHDEEILKKWKKVGYMEIWGKKLGYAFYEDAVKYDVYKETKKVKSPVLIIHGDNDDLVPIRHAEEIYKTLNSEKKLHIIKGADHFFKEIPHFKELINTAHGWLKEKLSV